MSQTTSDGDPGVAERRSWMGLLAASDVADLEAGWDRLAAKPEWRWLRPPESGLVMVRGRAGGNGRPFNLGEMTVTRCALVTEDGQTGQAYVAGRDRRHAELAALFDALLQADDSAAELKQTLLPLLAHKKAARKRTAIARSAPTKVDFFTLGRGENEA